MPAEGDTCNTVVMEGDVTVPYRFGSALGLGSGTSQTVISAACKGPCGAKPSSPVDLMLVVDRTSSMSGIDTVNARAAADSVRKAYNPAEQWMGLGLLGPGHTVGSCVTVPDPSIGTANMPADLHRWVPIELTALDPGAPVNANYAAGGSAMAGAISCYTNSSTGTDLADPVTAAAWELIHRGRPLTDVTKGIILETDGQPNNSTIPTANSAYCAQSYAAADAAKSQGIEVFTIGFGLDGNNNATCPDTSGPWQGVKATHPARRDGDRLGRRRLPGQLERRRRPLLLPAEVFRRQREPVGPVQAGGERPGRRDEAHPAAIGAARGRGLTKSAHRAPHVDPSTMG